MQRIDRKGKFRHRLPADQMFLDDAFQNLRCATVIPDAFRIDHGNRAARADAQAARLGAIHQRVRADEIQFLQARLQKIPRPEGLFARAAFGFIRIHAEKNVAAKFFEAQRLNGGLQFWRDNLHPGRIAEPPVIDRPNFIGCRNQ